MVAEIHPKPVCACTGTSNTNLAHPNPDCPYFSDAPTPKQREERETKDGMTAEEIIEGVIYSIHEGTGSALTLEEAKVIRASLRTHSPEEPVGEEEAVALAKSYGYVVIHRSAWEFMRDDPHPERRDWNSPIGQPLDGEGS